jgi:hypothetical protein
MEAGTFGVLLSFNGNTDFSTRPFDPTKPAFQLLRFHPNNSVAGAGAMCMAFVLHLAGINKAPSVSIYASSKVKPLLKAMGFVASPIKVDAYWTKTLAPTQSEEVTIVGIKPAEANVACRQIISVGNIVCHRSDTLPAEYFKVLSTGTDINMVAQNLASGEIKINLEPANFQLASLSPGFNFPNGNAADAKLRKLLPELGVDPAPPNGEKLGHCVLNGMQGENINMYDAQMHLVQRSFYYPSDTQENVYMSEVAFVLATVLTRSDHNLTNSPLCRHHNRMFSRDNGEFNGTVFRLHLTKMVKAQRPAAIKVMIASRPSVFWLCGITEAYASSELQVAALAFFLSIDRKLLPGTIAMARQYERSRDDREADWREAVYKLKSELIKTDEIHPDLFGKIEIERLREGGMISDDVLLNRGYSLGLDSTPPSLGKHTRSAKVGDVIAGDDQYDGKVLCKKTKTVTFPATNDPARLGASLEARLEARLAALERREARLAALERRMRPTKGEKDSESTIGFGPTAVRQHAATPGGARIKPAIQDPGVACDYASVSASQAAVRNDLHFNLAGGHLQFDEDTKTKANEISANALKTESKIPTELGLANEAAGTLNTNWPLVTKVAGDKCLRGEDGKLVKTQTKGKLVNAKTAAGTVTVEPW